MSSESIKTMATGVSRLVARISQLTLAASLTVLHPSTSWPNSRRDSSLLWASTFAVSS